MLNRLIVSDLVVHFGPVCCLCVSTGSLAVGVIVPEGRVVHESARQKRSLALLDVRKVRHGLRVMLSRGEDRRWEACAHMVMHVDHSLVRVEVMAVNHCLVNGLAW